MSLYKGQADQAVIQAARSAYTMPKPVDYTKFIEGLGEVAEFVIGKIGAVNDRMSTISGFEEDINKQMWSNNNKSFFDDHKKTMVDASNIMKFNPKWSQEYKDAEKTWNAGQGVLDKIKNDEEVLEAWIKSSQRGLIDLSTFNSPALISLMADIKLGKNFDNSVEFTKDGIMVIGLDGDPRNKIFINELPQIVAKTDGKETKDFIENSITSGINSKVNGTWNSRSKYTIMENIKSQIDSVGINNMGSAAFDYEYVTELGNMSFADYLFETDSRMKEGFDAYLEENPGKHSNDALKGIKHMIAQNLWDSDLLMKDEFVKFVENSLDFQINEFDANKRNVNNNNRNVNNNRVSNKYENLKTITISGRGDDQVKQEGTNVSPRGFDLNAGDISFSGNTLMEFSTIAREQFDEYGGTMTDFKVDANGDIYIQSTADINWEKLTPHKMLGGEISDEERNYKYSKLKNEILDYANKIGGRDYALTEMMSDKFVKYQGWGGDPMGKIEKIGKPGANIGGESWSKAAGILSYDGGDWDVIEKLNKEYGEFGFKFSEDENVAGIITGDALEIIFTMPDNKNEKYRYSEWINDTGLQEYDNVSEGSDSETAKNVMMFMKEMIKNVQDKSRTNVKQYVPK